MGAKRSIIRQKIRNGAKQSPKELASCYGKIRHSSYAAAVKANEAKYGLVKAYHCLFCKNYHVGRAK